MEKKWYVIHAFAGKEKKVKESLEERIALEEAEDSFGRIMIPTEEVVSVTGGEGRQSVRKFFPGYVLVEMEMNKDTWHLVNGTPLVLGFISPEAGKPAPVSEEEVKDIFARMEESSGQPKPKTVFQPGESVRVIDGPFSEFSAVIEQVNLEKKRVQVEVMIFGRPTPVELEFSQIEKS